MWNYLREKWQTAKLKAKYQRLVQERVLDLLAESGPQPVAEDPGQWTLLGNSASQPAETVRIDQRARARQIARENPYARNLLRLLEIYVTGPGLKLSHISVTSPDADQELQLTANRLWKQFLTANRRHFSYREYACRTWRDGECFLRKFPLAHWPPTVRFIDPETIAATQDAPETQGILTDPDDVETPIAYLRIDPRNGALREEIPAEEIFHCRIGADSNQKRGCSLLAPLIEMLHCFDRWRDTELTARKLQASIVLWRKVQGSPSQVAAFADAAQTANSSDPFTNTRRENYRAGTILTTSQGTELEFLHPKTNFADAVPLGRMLLLSIAAGSGLPEFMLTSDASNGNFASTMVAEGPAVKLFENEQQFFAREFTCIWQWVMSEAMAHRLLPEDFFERIDLEWSFPQLVNRDRNQERLALARLAETRILSRAEIARREGTDPTTMQREIQQELSLNEPPESPRINSQSSPQPS